MSDSLLEVSDLHVAYGKAEVLHGISLSMKPGSIVTVIGANGAGKTTMLNAIMGLIPSRGPIHYDGQPIPSSIEARVAAGLCLVPEKRELFATLALEANIDHCGFLRSRSEPVALQDEVYERFPRL